MEQLPSSEYSPEKSTTLENKSERGSIFGSLYKSKAARIAAFLAVVGGGSVLPFGQKSFTQEIRPKIEMVDQGLDLKELSDRFVSKVEIKDEDRSIIHIGQTHEGFHFMDAQAIQSQKNLEQLYFYLQREYGLNDFYLEGNFPVEVAFLRQIREQGVPLEGEAISVFWERIVRFSKAAETAPSEALKRQELYAAQVMFDKAILEFQTEYANFQKTGVADFSYQTLFKSWVDRQAEFDVQQTALKAIRDHIAEDSSIAGDAKYLMGAGEKLFLEGRINIHAAEDEKVHAEAATKLPHILEGDLEALTDLDEWKNLLNFTMKGPGAFWDEINCERDKVAVSLASEARGQFVPVVYGKNHDFKEAVEEYNKNNLSARIGLITIMPKAQK